MSPRAAEGADAFFETCFICCVLSRVGLRIGMFSELAFRNISDVRDLTSPENRADPKKHLWSCVLALGSMKNGSFVEEFRTAIVGCPVHLGIVDEREYSFAFLLLAIFAASLPHPGPLRFFLIRDGPLIR